MISREHKRFVRKGGLIGGLVLTIMAGSAQADDITTLTSRLYNAYLAEGAQSQSVIQSEWSTIQVNGSWTDINYGDQSRDVWAPATHLYRIQDMAKAYRTVGHFYYNNASVMTACSNGLNYWFSTSPSSDNWWWNEIGANLSLMQTLILLQTNLTAGQLSSGNSWLARATMSGFTGQNLVWEAKITAVRGCLQNNAATVTTAINAIKSTVVLTTGEGIQPDYSFQQHDELLYSGGYGAGFSVDTSFFANITAGLQWAFTAGQIDIISGLILDGQRWMTRGRMFDYGVHGRGISRKDITAYEIIAAQTNMAQIGTARQAEFNAFYNQLTQATPANSPAVTGNRHFWHSDFMSHSRPGCYMSTRMYSTRNFNTDANSDGTPINGEGKRSHHIADGCTFIFRDGEEYYNIFGVWDWYRVPGTTVEYGSSFDTPLRFKQSKSFVGGVSDGTYGVATMDLLRGNMSFKKSWFYFDNEIICMGAGITDASANATNTTLNQCLLRGTVTVKDSLGTRTLTNGDWTLSGLVYAHQDDVGYVFPTPAAARLKNQTQTGTWNNINDVYPAGEIDSKSVFMLWLDHGPNVSGASYAYIVVPNVTAAQLTSYAVTSPTSIASNTTTLQAAENASLGVAGATFYVAGTATLPSGLTVVANQPCVVLARFMTIQYEVSVSNPSNASLSVNVDINRYLSGTSATWMPGSQLTRLAFSLPSGNDAGNSVVKTFSLPTASNPSPVSGATLVDPRVALAWAGAAGVTGHQVFLGTSASAVTNATTASPEYKATLAPGITSYDPPGVLGQNVTYYWRIDEVPPVGPAVTGTVWLFSTLRIPGDFDEDLDVDQSDFAHLQRCLSGAENPYPAGCGDASLDSDSDVDAADLTAFLNCMRGADVPPGC